MGRKLTNKELNNLFKICLEKFYYMETLIELMPIKKQRTSIKIALNKFIQNNCLHASIDLLTQKSQKNGIKKLTNLLSKKEKKSILQRIFKKALKINDQEESLRAADLMFEPEKIKALKQFVKKFTDLESLVKAVRLMPLKDRITILKPHFIKNIKATGFWLHTPSLYSAERIAEAMVK